MKKVCIIIILITIIIKTAFTDNSKYLLCLFCCSALFYVFGNYLIKKIEIYLYKKKLEKDFEIIFAEEFLLKIKKEITLLKIKNELKKISNSELRTDQPIGD